MNKKIIAITIVILVFGALIAWALLSPKNGTVSNTTDTESTGGIGSLFPFFGGTTGGSATEGSTGDTTGGTGDETPPEIQKDVLRKISNRVIAGVTILPIKKPLPEEEAVVLPTVRLAERGTGYIFDVDVRGENEKKLTGTTVVRTAEARFGDNGNSVALRYVKTNNATVATFLGKVTPNPEGGVGDLKGQFLPDNIIDLVFSPDGKSLAYLLKNSNGSVGFTTKSDGTSRSQSFTSPFSEWLLGWSEAGLNVTTKAASTIPGYMYQVKSGALTKIFGGIEGLTTLASPNGKQILYGIGDEGTTSLYVRNLSTGDDINLGLTTLPEKCVWGKNNSTVYCGATDAVPRDAYPNAWYQGTYFFSDSLWRVDTETGKTTLLSTTVGLDATQLILDDEERYLVFVDKRDGSLWSLDIDKALE